MAHLRDSSFSLVRAPKHWLTWLFVAPLLILTLSARSDPSTDEMPNGPTPQPAAALAAPPSVPPADPAVTQAAAIVTPPAKPDSDDRQRRMLMLLLMNSAGPIRPYGNLGR